MRFSLATLLALTAYAALACVALARPAFHWASLVWNISLVLLCLGLIALVTARRRDRAYWAGFAVCGWAHYLLALGPWQWNFNSYIYSRAVLDFLCVMLDHHRPVDTLVNSYGHGLLSAQPPIHLFTSYNDDVRTYAYFMLSGFAVFSVLSGLAGGWLSNWLFATAKRAES